MHKESPIGIFDSGLGGLTVLRELVAVLPGEDIVYYGDTAHLPYGDKSRAQMMRYAREITDFMLERDVKAVVAACGTHSSTTLEYIAQWLPDRPVLGVVLPAVRTALQCSRNHKIGIAATQATVNAGAHAQMLQSFNPAVQCYPVACPRLVPLVEQGQLDGEETYAAVEEYMQPLKLAGIDTLILGCTHYPLLQDLFQQSLGPERVLVDPAEVTVMELKQELGSRDWLQERKDSGQRFFYTSGPIESFMDSAGCLFPDLMMVAKIV